MKISSEALNIQRSGTFEENVFKIAATGHAFKILSDGLYSNKIRAIIRELSCNAYDAHVAAGTTDRPFQVKLPTNFNPEFRVRDFGTGLSKEDVMNLYTSYFSSTKTATDDMTGCFGLGSKSPFAYTDTFTVTSYFNGKKNVYSALIAEKGFPSIVHLAEEDTTEHNGLEVSFPVSQKDFDPFKMEASFVFAFFDRKPELLGVKDLPLYFKDPIIDQKNWSIHPHKNRYNTNTYVSMGNVGYQINVHDYIGWEFTQYLHGKVLILKAPIGAVEITPSRESLSFTNKTKKVVQDITNDFKSSFKKHLLSELAKKPTLYQARLFYKEFSGVLTDGCGNKGTVIWNGHKVHEPVLIDKDLKIKRISIGSNYKNSGNGNTYAVSIEQPFNAQNKQTVWDPIKGIYKYERDSVGQICLEYNMDPTEFVYYNKNTSKLSLNKCAEWLRRNNSPIGKHFHVIEGEYSLAKKFLFENFDTDIDDLKTLNDIGVPTDFVTPKQQKKPSVLKLVDNACWVELSDGDLDFAAGGYYIPLVRTSVKVSFKKDTVTLTEFSNIVDLYHTVFKKTKPSIYGVRSKDLKDFKNAGNWIDISQEMYDTVLNFDSTKILSSKSISQSVSSVFKKWAILFKNNYDILEHKELEDNFNLALEADKDSIHASDFIALAHNLTVPVKDVQNLPKIKSEELLKAFYIKYPMLSYLEYSSVPKNYVFDYVKMVNNQKKEEGK